MTRQRNWHWACISALVSITVNAQQHNHITVRVLSDGHSCIVYTQQIHCDVVGAFLHDDRRVDFTEAINITTDGAGEASRVRGLKIRDDLAKVGYSNVVVVSFITVPGSSSETRP